MGNIIDLQHVGPLRFALYGLVISRLIRCLDFPVPARHGQFCMRGYENPVVRPRLAAMGENTARSPAAFRRQCLTQSGNGTQAGIQAPTNKDKSSHKRI
jgi:hypothetical protein